MYMYKGHGDDSIPKNGNDGDAPGIAVLVFADEYLSNGWGRFTDFRREAPFALTEFQRIDDAEERRRTEGKGLGSFKGKLAFAHSELRDNEMNKTPPPYNR